MTKEILDVVDTAVKIGLGAIITGIITFAVNSKNHKHEKNKYLLEHKIQTIETCAEKMDEYFDALQRLLSKISAIVRRMNDAGIALNEISNSRKKQIKERDKILVESWSTKNYAVSRFRMLRAKNIVQAMHASKKLQKAIRDKAIFGNELPSYEECKRMRSELNKIRGNVHEEIALFYANESA